MKVATLEGELKQQQESTQAVGKEPYHLAPYHAPCTRYGRTSTCLCSSGFWDKGKGNHKGGWGATLLGNNPSWAATFYLQNPI